jgi:hypothetical protein
MALSIKSITCERSVMAALLVFATILLQFVALKRCFRFSKKTALPKEKAPNNSVQPTAISAAAARCVFGGEAHYGILRQALRKEAATCLETAPSEAHDWAGR